MILNDRERQKIFITFYASNNNQKQFFGRWYLYAGKKYIIGRKDSDINIRHPLISKQHLEITFYTRDLIKIKDLFSRNGTYINNNKVTPNQEIKFSTKDKLSLGDIDNTIVFLENEENKKSIFQSKIDNENERNASEETQKIVNTEPDRNLTYNRNRQTNLRNNYQNRLNQQNQPYFRYRFRPQQRYIRNNFISNDNNRTFDNQNRRYQNYNNYNQNFIRRNYDDYLKREIRNSMNNKEFLGKKQERIENNDYQRRHLQQLIESKKRGIEILKQKLKDIDDADDTREKGNENTEEKNDGKIINIKEDEDVEKIILKPKNLKNLEFVMPNQEKSGGNKVKYLVDGYMVLDVKNKNLILE